MQVTAGNERREHPRKLIDIKAFISLSSASKDHYLVSVHDISLSGMAINPGPLTLHEGDKLCLCLSGGIDKCLQEHLIEATVVNLRQGLVGVRFDSVGIHILQDIHRLLRSSRNF